MVRIDATRTSPPFRAPWQKGVAMGRAFELLRADAQEHIRLIQREIRFEYCRFHGLFHDDVSVVVRAESGALAFQWGHVDRIFDFLLSVGLRPFVELGPMPAALASGDQTFFHWRMNVTPPRDWAEWGQLVEAFARHCVARYGLDEVRRWYFEVWNEPNLGAFWSGTQEEYWRLYEVAASALKRVDAGLRVGGPASAEAGWIPEFLASCSPIDFVSTHAYPQNELAAFEAKGIGHEPGMYLIDTVRAVRSLVGPRELHWTEWSSLDATTKADVDWYANETIDQLYAAALICHVCTHLDGDVDGFFWWVASDIFEEMGMPQSPFSNNFGMVTVDGIPKASFHAFRLLSLMRGSRVHCEVDAPSHCCGAVATLDGETLKVLLWNHVPLGSFGSEWAGSVLLDKLDRSRLVTSIHVQEGAGSAYEKWIEMGRPQNPTPIQQEALQAFSQPAYRTGSLDFRLKPGEVIFFEIAGPADPVILKGNDASVTDFWNQALSDIPVGEGP